ncbi:MAG: UPF0262 family protein [Proteobacteria bacterium]|nr:UPF0262 family protein [Pseudomonadota bacterium]
MTGKPPGRLGSVELDSSLGRGPSPEAEHERATAIYDLIEDNRFALANGVPGPYHLILSTQEGRLVLDVRNAAQQPIMAFGLSLTPFRRIVRDYFAICDSYYEAIRSASPQQIETIDMARRGLHNEGSEILMERLAGKVDTDLDTARRLFTLVCALVWKG